jgi:hypothetical protein
MRDEETITINNKTSKFIELIYYDGVKLQVDLRNNLILVWHNYMDEHEEWFLVKTDRVSLNGYLSCEISLLDVFNTSEVYASKRTYENYDEVFDIEKITQSDRYEFPSREAYLSFDFTLEKQYFDFIIDDYILPSPNYSYNVSKSSYVISDREVTLNYATKASSYISVNMSTWGDKNNAAA